MATYLTQYRPLVHGFQFRNRFQDNDLGSITIRGRCCGLAQVSLDYFFADRPAPLLGAVDHDIRPVSGIAAAAWSSDRIDLFVRGEDNRLVTKHLQDGRFSRWIEISSPDATLSPAVTAAGPRCVDIVARAGDGQCWHLRYDPRDADLRDPCRPLPGPTGIPATTIDSSPALVAPSPDRLEAYALGFDSELISRSYDGVWREWRSLGGPRGVRLASDPAAAGCPGWTLVLALGSDGAVWQREWRADSWRPWRSLGGRATSAPAVASTGRGRAHAYARGPDGNMSVNVLADGRWTGWTSLGAPPPGLGVERPAAISLPGLMDVYALAADQSVWHKRWSDGWRPWQSTEALVSPSANRLTDAIRARFMVTTVEPLRLALSGQPPGPLVGTWAGYLGARNRSASVFFAAAYADEMSKLARILTTGAPVSAGLVAARIGHEVVVYGGDIAPGARSTLYVYDPDYPGCDHMTITLDPIDESIVSASGENWLWLWIRDDIERRTPPV